MSAERIAYLNDFARTRHPGLVGAEVLSCDPELVTGRLAVTEPLVAGTGFLWAPVVITLADWLCACGIGPHLPEGASFTTLEIKTNFLGTVREGWDVEVSDESNGKVIALFRCTQMILRPKA